MDPTSLWNIQSLEFELNRILAIAKAILQKEKALVPVAIIYDAEYTGSTLPISMENRQMINPTLKAMVKEFNAVAILIVADTYAAKGSNFPEDVRVRDIPGRVEGILVQGVTVDQLYCSKFQVYERGEDGSINFVDLPETSFTAPLYDITLQDVFDVDKGPTIH